MVTEQSEVTQQQGAGWGCGLRRVGLNDALHRKAPSQRLPLPQNDPQARPVCSHFPETLIAWDGGTLDPS